jgi:hypothetical protein
MYKENNEAHKDTVQNNNSQSKLDFLITGTIHLRKGTLKCYSTVQVDIFVIQSQSILCLICSAILAGG